MDLLAGKSFADFKRVIEANRVNGYSFIVEDCKNPDNKRFVVLINGKKVCSITLFKTFYSDIKKYASEFSKLNYNDVYKVLLDVDFNLFVAINKRKNKSAYGFYCPEANRGDGGINKYCSSDIIANYMAAVCNSIQLAANNGLLRKHSKIMVHAQNLTVIDNFKTNGFGRVASKYVKYITFIREFSKKHGIIFNFVFSQSGNPIIAEYNMKARNQANRYF